MIEKTRYPGCVEYLKVLRECGYFSYDTIDIKGKKIRPIDLTAKLLLQVGNERRRRRFWLED